VHEWGHFYFARKLGVKVEEFGFGFPPKLFSFVKNGIRYSLNTLPLGGFVKIFGEHGEGERDKKSFSSRPVWQRFIILAAGVFMNLVLAWIFFSIGAGLGMPKISEDTETPVTILAVRPGSPAEQSGLRLGDQILEMRSPEISLRVESEEDVGQFTAAYRGEEVTMVIRRSDLIKEVQVVPRVNAPAGEGPIGVALGRLALAKTSWYLAPFVGLQTLIQSVETTVLGIVLIIKDLVTEGGTKVAISGPGGIFAFHQDSRALGASFFLQFIGILSVNLAILNFLPIPALDGGRILFLALEKIKGRRIDPQIENIAHLIGFVLLILLMLLVTYGDIAKII
jgi:regulator of sigma E protease